MATVSRMGWPSMPLRLSIAASASWMQAEKYSYYARHDLSGLFV